MATYNDKLINRLTYPVAVFTLTIAFLSGGCGDPGYTFSPVGIPSLVSGMASKEYTIDATEWKVAPNANIPLSIQLDFSSERTVKKSLQQYAKDKLIEQLAANGFRIGDGSTATLSVRVLRVREVNNTLWGTSTRIVKARLAVWLTHNDELILQGISDGIEAREDMSWFLGIPRRSYEKAIQRAISKLVRQTKTMRKT